MTVVAITADKGFPKDKLDQLSRQTNIPLLKKNEHPDYLLHLGIRTTRASAVPKTDW